MLLLQDSALQAPIRALADCVGEILADNKLPFFPDYTDHGMEHINRVLEFEALLVPDEVWENSKKDSGLCLLCDADAAVLIGATLLHDLAMHLRPKGFIELISKDTRFRPLQWFKENHEGHTADESWPELWAKYLREAKSFSDKDLTNIVGESEALLWKFDGLPENAGEWTMNDHLIIGEFIRRHHARLGHEIAIYGFPGLASGDGKGLFPAMGERRHALKGLADLIGLTARSHGLSLRVCRSYLDKFYHSTPQPMSTAVLYPMALLRVADYLQIDANRAPPVLLQLRDPQSPISVQEWEKHAAVVNIGPADDKRGRMIMVSEDISLSLYLQLHELLKGLQAELDHATAVLDEAYGLRSDLGLDRLTLSTRRIYSNLHEPLFCNQLPYVPLATGFSADPSLLTLLVEPLYGNKPGFGVRELIQNAVDAVRELTAWSKQHGNVTDLPCLDEAADVLIDFIKRADGSWIMRVQDRGIGMTAETIQNYFLRAGASFRRSVEWKKEFIDENGRPRVARSGHFGVGAFAIFLLGATFRLETRHAASKRPDGYEIKCSQSDQRVEIRRNPEVSIGTLIEVELRQETIEYFELNAFCARVFDAKDDLQRSMHRLKETDWYRFCFPKVVIRVRHQGEYYNITHGDVYPIHGDILPPEWSVIRPDGFDAIYWTFGGPSYLSCNGIIISDSNRSHVYMKEDHLNFQLEYIFDIDPTEPFVVAVIDDQTNLPLTILRDKLARKAPFAEELSRDVILSFIAYMLICGPHSWTEAYSSFANQSKIPRFESAARYLNRDTLVDFGTNFSLKTPYWCLTPQDFFPCDPWLCSTSNHNKYIIFGYITRSISLSYDFSNDANLLEPLVPSDCVLIRYDFDGGSFISFSEILFNPIYKYNGSEVNRAPLKDWDVETIATLSELADRKISSLLGQIETSKLYVSVRIPCSFDEIIKYDEAKVPEWLGLQFPEWRETDSPDGSTRQFEMLKGAPESNLYLEKLLEVLNFRTRQNKSAELSPAHEHSEIIASYVGEFRTKQEACVPKTLTSKVWRECLGRHAVPFDLAAREQLIARGEEHCELKRHIDAWRKMVAVGSKWATCDWAAHYVQG